MIWNWLPWKYLIGRLARAHGFLDPLSLLAQAQRFSQPSEVAAPIELLRAGIAFHARGIINSRSIQHNLDWAWPYWVKRQYHPKDPAFLPRAFSTVHVNLTQRNWTAVGLPNCNALPLVDPRGLATPFYNGWSLDAWVVDETGEALLPATAPEAQQRALPEEDDFGILTRTTWEGLALHATARVHLVADEPWLELVYEGLAERAAWLAVSVRPFNPEGVSVLETIALAEDRAGWTVDKRAHVKFDQPCERHAASNYHDGDVYLRLLERAEKAKTRCEVGLPTAAALFRIEPHAAKTVTVRVPLREDTESKPLFAQSGTLLQPHARGAQSWREALQGLAALKLPDARIVEIYDAGLRALILHAPGDIYPGPYTYKRFWYRDAALILNGMLCVNMLARAGAALERFPARQSLTGFFHSQEGEWDANGMVLWIWKRFRDWTDTPLKESWLTSIRSGAKWIKGKRCAEDGSRHGGLLPAGFSAEHFGNNDHYYWDDFWSVAGLRAAAELVREHGHEKEAGTFAREAEDLLRCINASIGAAQQAYKHAGIAASPYRRLDSAAVGCLCADYPLQLYPADDARIEATLDHLLVHCIIDDTFYHDISHAGVNAYLTLHIAQALLRREDPRALELLEGVRDLASPTGQWPEAAHPQLKGGNMGDGQHTWAVAEWMTMLRHLFVREEGEKLILLAGIAPKWVETGETLFFGPTPTAHGPLSVEAKKRGEAVDVDLTTAWRGAPPTVEVRLPGYAPRTLQPEDNDRLRLQTA